MIYLAFSALKSHINFPKYLYFKIAVYAEQAFLHNFEMAYFALSSSSIDFVKKKKSDEYKTESWCSLKIKGNLDFEKHIFILKTACVIQNKKIIKYMLENKVKEVSYYLLVKYLCRYCDIEIVQELFSKKIKYNNFGLERACKSFNKPVIEFLLAKGANLNKGLIYASFLGNLELLKYLLSFSLSFALRAKEGSNESSTKEESIDFNEIFTTACRYNHMHIIRFLETDYPLDINEGFISACIAGHKKLIKKLIKRGANKFNKGLLIAAAKNNLELLNFFIGKGANELNGAFGMGCYHGSGSIIANLIVMLRGTDILDYNFGLKKACAGGHLEIARFLIDIGATNINGCFFDACKSENLDLVILLIKAGASDFNAGLQGAAESCCPEEVSEKLLELGANPDYGLIGACNFGEYENIEYFIKKGASNAAEMMDLHKNDKDLIELIEYAIKKITSASF